MSSVVSKDASDVIPEVSASLVGQAAALSNTTLINLQPKLPQWVYIQNTPSTSVVDKNTTPLQFTHIPNVSLISTPTQNVILTQPTSNTSNESVLLTKPPPSLDEPHHKVILPQPTPVVNKPHNIIIPYPPPRPRKPQQIVIQNPNTLQTVPIPVTLSSKTPLTYVTMIKTSQQLGIQTIPNQKFVIASMPKITTNRLPVTVTTNSVKPTFSLFDSSKPQSTPSMNVKIANGKIQSDDNGCITVMCSNDLEPDLNVKQDDSVIRYDKSVSNLITPCTDVMIYDDNAVNNSPIGFNNTKHGISILKKFFNTDKKCEKMYEVNKIVADTNITTISDPGTKEVKITTSCSNNDETVINITTAPNQKTERRRKSHFSYRQDCDDIIFTESKIQKSLKLKKKKAHEFEKTPEEKLSIKPDINMNEDLDDINDHLVWDDGIGSLPGSDIKFIYNKYKFLQMLTKVEYIEIMNKKASKAKVKNSSALEEMCCLQCGCFGLPSEFINSKYCSYTCRDFGVKASKLKERNFRLRAFNYYNKKSKTANSDLPSITDTKMDKEQSSDEEMTSNENSQDKYSLPWNCAKKGFSWSKYLEHVKAKAAPVKLFKDPFPYNRNGFKPGMKLEGVDPQHPSYFCVLTVVEVIGYRLRLHFDGYSDNYDFWVNADSMDIFPAGWCEKYGHELRPPPAYQEYDFNWTSYMKNTRCILAPKHLFADRGVNAICPNGFRIGMKLEAVDRKNTSLICVASVTDMMDNRILIHFDSWDDIYDYWADPMSPFIHPVGWADKNGHNLTPPNDYPKPETFNWENYLKDKKFVAAPSRAFKQRPSCGFKKGMRLECVDKRVPRLIRAATVDDVKDHQIRISFDGWPDRYSYWIDTDSTEIHPVGWCQKTGHPIEPPLTPADVYDFLECPTIGCRGLGHIEGSKNPTHSLPSECPYSDENLGRDHVLPDRLLSPDRQLESVVPISREPKEKSRKRSKTKRILNDYDGGTDNENDDIDMKIGKKMKIELDEQNIDMIHLPLTNGYANVQSELLWENHTNFLQKHIKNISSPKLWECSDVVRFIASLPGCGNYSVLFNEHNINGHAFLMLSQNDLTKILKIKLGHAIKIYSAIVLLRRHKFC